MGQLCKTPLSVAPPNGPNLNCKNPPLPVKYNQSELRGVCQSLSCIPCWQPPSLMQRVLGSAPPQKENNDKYRSIISEVEGAAGFVRTFLMDK